MSLGSAGGPHARRGVVSTADPCCSHAAHPSRRVPQDGRSSRRSIVWAIPGAARQVHGSKTYPHYFKSMPVQRARCQRGRVPAPALPDIRARRSDARRPRAGIHQRNFALFPDCEMSPLRCSDHVQRRRQRGQRMTAWPPRCLAPGSVNIFDDYQTDKQVAPRDARCC